MAGNAQLERWVEDFAARELPVLASSGAALAQLRANEDSVRPRELAQAVLRDPMLTLLVLRHLRQHHSRRMLEDITTVEHAVMMLGVRRFFSAFGNLPAIESQFAGQAEALAGVRQVLARARSAAAYAGALAALRGDLVTDEVIAAALLHDMAELLLWCFAPAAAADIAARQRTTSGLRSAEAQRAVLGFPLLDLQLALVRRWDLPELFQALMDDAHAERPRVRNVALAVALARHSAHGWDDPALPSDIEEIARLVAQPEGEVRVYLFEAALRALAEADTAGAPGYLPPLPRENPPLAGAFECLGGIERGQPRRGQSRGAMMRDARHEQLAAAAAFMDGITAGLGFARALWLAPDVAGQCWQPRYAAGRGAAGTPVLDAATREVLAQSLAKGAPSVHLERDEHGGTRGAFVQPVLHQGRICALAAALEPVHPARLAPGNFHQFKELGEQLQRTLDAVGGAPAWLETGG